MRLLFTCRPLAGHYDPLLSLAGAAGAAGHAVAFATGEPVVGRARAAGFEAFAAGIEAIEARPGGQRLDGDAGRLYAFTRLFADRELEPRARDLEAIVADWRPDVIVHEVAELAAPLVATAAGLPYATLSFGVLLQPWLAEAAGEAAAPHWIARGLEPHPLAGLYRHLYIDRCPPGLQIDEIAQLPLVQALNPAADLLPPGAEPPAWLDSLDAAQAVYVTLGTVWNRDLDVFRALVGALAREPLTLIVTLGSRNDPAALGPQRAGVHVERFVPQAFVLPRCDAVVTHGGSGSVIGPLAFGLPLVLVPQGADQFYNAERVVAAGAGIQLERDDLSAAAVRGAVRAVLDEPGYRTAARAIADEIAAMPGAGPALHALERLAAG